MCGDDDAEMVVACLLSSVFEDCGGKGGGTRDKEGGDEGYM